MIFTRTNDLMFTGINLNLTFVAASVLTLKMLTHVEKNNRLPRQRHLRPHPFFFLLSFTVYVTSVIINTDNVQVLQIQEWQLQEHLLCIEQNIVDRLYVD